MKSAAFSEFSHKSLKDFIHQVWVYYEEEGRNFPWRETSDPYKIVVSEIMLQQTQTFRVVEKYLDFVKSFPTFQSLYSAPMRAVLKKWQGLGYNRRAIALKKIAQIVIEKYEGILPKTLSELDELPGIGHATAASISAFAYNIPHAFIETNIRRAFLHFFFPAEKNVPDEKLLPLIESTLDRKNPREWYFALMDYGAMLKKKVENPNRRSKHYAKQSVFAGSNRQIRGLVLQTISESDKKKLSEEELVDQLTDELSVALAKVPSERLRIVTAIEALSREGFFSREKGFIIVN